MLSSGEMTPNLADFISSSFFLSVDCRLHEALMKMQQQQQNSLRQWLTETEDRISMFGEPGPDLETARRQLEQHKVSVHAALCCMLVFVFFVCYVFVCIMGDILF